jgi:hypothetical protein
MRAISQMDLVAKAKSELKRSRNTNKNDLS